MFCGHWQDPTHIKIVDIVSDYVPVLVLGKHIISTLKGNRPVHQEEIKILDAQVIQCFLKCWSDIVRVVLVVPQLAGDENLAPRHAALLDSFPHSFLCTVAVNRVSLYVWQSFILFHNIFTISLCQCGDSRLGALQELQLPGPPHPAMFPAQEQGSGHRC